MKIGDRVRRLVGSDSPVSGLCGTVIAMNDLTRWVVVRFDKFTSGVGLYQNEWSVLCETLTVTNSAPAEPTGPMCATTPASAVLPSEAADRKKVPLAGGVFDYFTSALVEVAKVSYKGNEQHNPGQPLHWSRGKSADHADTMLRHFVERGSMDTDGVRHSAKMVWRALAILQLELEAAGAPVARGAKLPEETK